MPRDYAAMTTLVNTKLQSASTADWSTAEIDYQIEECLKEYSIHRRHIVPVTFKIESRYGTDVTGTASSLTDTEKDQFVSTDASDEKVVHNTTDDTWAVVKTYTDATVLVLTSDIMDADENYEIYNKRCWNNKQIYIGDMPEYLGIDSVEYPIGTRRNWRLYNQILELDIESVEDSNLNVTTQPNITVLVRFILPHILSNLTDWVGALSASATVGATTLAASGLAASALIEDGNKFYLGSQRMPYIVNADATASSTGTATINFYPPLEATANTATSLTLVKSTLQPNDEDTFADLVASRLAINKAPKYFNAISLGGGVVYQHFLTWGERRLSETLSKIHLETPPITKRRHPTE